MHLLPRASFEIRTSSHVNELVDVLSAATRPPLGDVELRELPEIVRRQSLFVGHVTIEGFELRRIIDYRNSAQPHLFGCFRDSESGAIVKVTARMARHTRLAVGALSLGLLLITLVCIGLAIAGELNAAAVAFPTAFLVILHFGTWFGFQREVGESGKTLEKLCGARRWQ